MTTQPVTLSVDELRVVTDIVGGTLPVLLDEYETAEPAADAAATRGLSARGLLTADAAGHSIDPALRTALAALSDPVTVLELERRTVRRAETTDPDGRITGFTAVADGVWRIDGDSGVSALLADLTEVSEPCLADDTRVAVAIPRHEHDLVADLVADGRHDEIAAVLARHPHSGALAAALADPAADLGRLTRVDRDDDATVREHSCAWVVSGTNAWTVFTSEPLHAEDDSVFLPADPQSLADQITAVLTGAAEPLGV